MMICPDSSHEPLGVLVGVVHVSGPGLAVKAIMSSGDYADMRLAARLAARMTASPEMS